LANHELWKRNNGSNSRKRKHREKKIQGDLILRDEPKGKGGRETQF